MYDDDSFPVKRGPFRPWKSVEVRHCIEFHIGQYLSSGRLARRMFTGLNTLSRSIRPEVHTIRSSVLVMEAKHLEDKGAKRISSLKSMDSTFSCCHISRLRNTCALNQRQPCRTCSSTGVYPHSWACLYCCPYFVRTKRASPSMDNPRRDERDRVAQGEALSKLLPPAPFNFQADKSGQTGTSFFQSNNSDPVQSRCGFLSPVEQVHIEVHSLSNKPELITETAALPDLVKVVPRGARQRLESRNSRLTSTSFSVSLSHPLSRQTMNKGASILPFPADEPNSFESCCSCKTLDGALEDHLKMPALSSVHVRNTVV
jgi:hypothetical protein